MKQRLSVALVIVMLLAALIPTTFTTPLSAYYRLMGDINDDGQVNITDILMLRAAIFGEIDLYDDDFIAADLNFDGEITITDILMVRDIIFGEEPPPWPGDDDPDTYTVRYDPGAYGLDEGFDDSSYEAGEYRISDFTFYRPGYRQKGWSLTDGGPKAFEINGIIMLEHDTTIYPYWELGVWSKDTPFDDCFFSLYDDPIYYKGPFSLSFDGSAESPTEKWPSITSACTYRPGYYYSQADQVGQMWRDWPEGWQDWQLRVKNWYILSDCVHKEWHALGDSSWLQTNSYADDPDHMENILNGARSGPWTVLSKIRQSGASLDSGGLIERMGSEKVLGRDCAKFRKDNAFIGGYDEYWVDKQTGFCLKEIKEMSASDGDYVHARAECISIKLDAEVAGVKDPPLPTEPDYFDMKD